MRTTEILDLLRANHGSYIEHTLGIYCIKDADGVRLLDDAPVHEQINDLVREFRIKLDGNRYILAA